MYRIELYDAFGNLITSPSVYAQTQWNASGILNNNNFSYFDSKQRALYDASGSDGGTGTIVISYTQDSVDVSDSVQIVIIPLISVVSIATHEWVADTADGLNEVLLVLDSVLGIDTSALWPDADFDSRNQAYLFKLRQYGYMPYRDGYLDYLDITFTEPFYLTEDIITDISFIAEIKGKPDTVSWLLQDTLRTITVVPADTLGPQDAHYTFRLWLIPNVINQKGTVPMETGLLPSVTFSNDQIKIRDAGKPNTLYLGNGLGLYTTPTVLTLDSAAPVISNFLLQNNACNPNNINNIVQIHFSEPVSYSNFPASKNIFAWTLINGNTLDSAFMRTSIVSGHRKVRGIQSISEWNAEGSDRMIIYEATINPDSNSKFIPNSTEIRFAVDSNILDIRDLNDNLACGDANKPVRLLSDNTAAVHICNLSGISMVDRFAAMNYTWSKSPDPKDKGELVPDFPYFGFTVNLQYVSQRTKQNTVIKSDVTVGGSTKLYVIVDYDTTHAFACTEVSIFDVLGNLVASPGTNDGLKSEYTILEIREYTGIEDLINSLDTMSLIDVKKHFTIYEADQPGEPDTLRPIYPATISIGYDFLKTLCGPQSGNDKVCIPAWNCLNSKGRLVAPGGYIARQYIKTGNVVSEEIKKLIVTSNSRKENF
jgi:hypothetical protein